MPWYYAGPEAKPVGPITLEELHARRVNGLLSPETYIIEYVGQPGDARAWKRYREVFPSSPSQPPLALPPTPPTIPPIPIVERHPLFPSAAPVSGHLPPTSRVASPPYLPPTEKANSWCRWGFGLSLGSLLLLLPSCGLTVFVALPALVVSIVGLMKVGRDHQQKGRNLALSGVFMSAATLIITVLLVTIAIPAFIKGHGQITTTEQSTNDAD